MTMQYNQISGVAYQGQNQFVLLQAKTQNNYKSDAWITFVQAKNEGLKLVNAKGKGIHISKGFGEFTKKDEKSGKVKTESRPLGWATVFNMDLTEKIIK